MSRTTTGSCGSCGIGTFGGTLAYTGINTQTVASDGALQWRHKKAMAGGGSLFDIGLYCLNTARFMTGEEPAEIFATINNPPNDPRFAEVEETVSFMLRFPSGTIANCFTSYGGRDDKHQRLNLETAVIDVPNAFQYVGQRMTVSSRQQDMTSENSLVLPHKGPVRARARSHGRLLDNRPPPLHPGRGRRARPQADGGDLRERSDRAAG